MDDYAEDGDQNTWIPQFLRFNFNPMKFMFLFSLAILANNIIIGYQMQSAYSDLFDAIEETTGYVRTLMGNVGNMIDATKINKLHLVSRLKQEIHASYVDKTDYACVSQGGTIVNESAVLISPVHNASNLILEQIKEAGQCWAFKAEAQVIIKLSRSVLVTAVTYEHISLDNLPTTAALKSAPREFSVYALPPDSSYPKPLGNFTYDAKGEPRQRFVLKDAMIEPVTFVLIKVSKNHGNKKYTCMYRLRVHGIEQDGGIKD